MKTPGYRGSRRITCDEILVLIKKHRRRLEADQKSKVVSEAFAQGGLEALWALKEEILEY